MSTGGGAIDKLSEVDSNVGNGNRIDKNKPLCINYPVNSVVELTLAPNKEVVMGLVYTTDEISNSIVLKKSLKHTTLASEIQICNANMIIARKILRGQSQDSNLKSLEKMENLVDRSRDKEDLIDEESEEVHAYNPDAEVSEPLPVVSKKALDEREKRTMRLTEEGFSQINQKASAEGQAVFDRLLKACNEVVWRDESIFVLNQIRVDPPYNKENCKLLVTANSADAGGSLNEGSLDRVKKIVGSSSSSSSSRK